MGGGLTISGGEPLVQAGFTGQLFAAAKRMGLHTALDTSGFLGLRADDTYLNNVDLVLLDIKSGDPDTYRRVTGKELEPTLRFAERLHGLGATPATPVTILSDGADGPRSLGEAASVGPTHHVLDWFHLSMRIQHVAQAAKSWPDVSAEDRRAGSRLTETIERIRWRLWHGQVRRGRDLIGETMATLEAAAEIASPASSAGLKVARQLSELETYVCGQSDIIIDYATARRRKEPISTAVTESTVQWLLHRRMNAQQQMHWTPRGAHLMLKVRCAVMNGTLEHDHAVAETSACRPFRRAA
jgi:hypothetical protein